MLGGLLNIKWSVLCWVGESAMATIGVVECSGV